MNHQLVSLEEPVMLEKIPIHRLPLGEIVWLVEKNCPEEGHSCSLVCLFLLISDGPKTQGGETDKGILACMQMAFWIQTNTGNAAQRLYVV